MKQSHYLIMLSMAVATGTALGMLSDRKRPGRGALLGAAAGIVAGSAAAGVYERSTRNGRIPFYSSSSPLYEDLDAI